MNLYLSKFMSVSVENISNNLLPVPYFPVNSNLISQKHSTLSVIVIKFLSRLMRIHKQMLSFIRQANININYTVTIFLDHGNLTIGSQFSSVH